MVKYKKIQERNDKMKLSLVVLAAGLGSRYGGLKQMDPIGPNQEAILEFSAYDALQAGFQQIVFIIRKEMEADFKEMIGDKIAKHIEVKYVFQSLESVLPQGFQPPSQRSKPWGTGHAMLCVKDVVDGPFVIINADDFYGRRSYQMVYDYLIHHQDDPALVGYTLENTLTENGSVTRGICIAEDGYLASVKERKQIEQTKDGVAYYENDQWHLVDGKSLVSMNMWGFYPSIFPILEKAFHQFLNEKVSNDPLKSEFLIPVFIDQCIQQKEVKVTLLGSDEKWFGVTYKEDKPKVKENIKQYVDQGLYPNNLWK